MCAGALDLKPGVIEWFSGHFVLYYSTSSANRLKHYETKIRNHEMRRARIGYDIRKDTKPSHLASIGGITIAWNEIEALVDAVLGGAIDGPGMLRLEITVSDKWIPNGKTAIIKVAAKSHIGFPKSVCKMIEETCGVCERHKKFRDGVVHAHILSPMIQLQKPHNEGE